MSSYYFYAAWDWRFLGLLIASTVVDYSCARALDRQTDPAWRKRLLWLSITFNLTLLGVFKYFNFFCGQLARALRRDRVAGGLGRVSGGEARPLSGGGRTPGHAKWLLGDFPLARIPGWFGLFHLTGDGWLVFRASSTAQIGSLTASQLTDFALGSVNVAGLLVPLALHVTPLMLVLAGEAWSMTFRLSVARRLGCDTLSTLRLST